MCLDTTDHWKMGIMLRIFIRLACNVLLRFGEREKKEEEVVFLNFFEKSHMGVGGVCMFIHVCTCA